MSGISIQRRRGTTNQHQTFTGLPGETTVDTTKWVMVVHDGSTAGGVPMAKEVHSHSTATESVPGFLSATDKTKLDGLPDGGIFNQTVKANNSAVAQRHALNLSLNFQVTDDNAGDQTLIDLTDTGVTPGQYTKVTVGAKGRISSGTVLGPSDIPNLTSSKITDFAAAVAAIGLVGSPTGDISLDGYKIVNLQDPSNSTDAATKQYVDAAITGLSFKEAVRVATVTNINLSAPGSAIDGITLVPGDRVLVKNQDVPTQNGIYVFASGSQPLQRALDATSGTQLAAGSFVLVTEGNTNADYGYVNASDGAITVGVSPILFTQFSSPLQVTAGNGIEKVGNTLSVKSANTSRIAVGVGGVDLATIPGLSASTYNTVTVNTFGQVTAASNVAYQPLASILTSVAALATNGMICRTAPGVSTIRVLTAGTGITLNNADGVGGNPTVSVTPDSVVEKVKVSKDGSLVGSRSELNLITGAGVILTVNDNPGNNRMDVTIASTGGGQAPATATFLTTSAEGTLGSSRQLVLGPTLTAADGGPGSTYTLNTVSDLGSVP